ncbi:putative PurR-regulated permease PerM [Stackebrandtia albiflava]|uniref:Putative PurR-regulated permease PerM n=1 Tax=Stackebrandtia albiflava TaxID=406432 RepID=A0A562V4H0_9ACTN|nr:AI-2E family transporter [Stackebrandtia albiflava]TWJ12789.1 putative PurR-regulated permease PerM [Stackebrandtia albiflava]
MSRRRDRRRKPVEPPSDDTDARGTSPEPPPADTPAAGAPASPFGASGRPFAKTPFHQGLYGGLGLLAAWLIYQSLGVVLGLLVVIVVAAFIAIGLNPVVVRLQRLGLPRGLAVTTVCLAAILVLCGGLLAIVPPIITEGTAFIDALPDYIDTLSHQPWVLQLQERYDIVQALRDAASGLSAATVFDAAGGIASVLGVAIGSVFDGVMIVLLTVYFLVSFDRLKAGFYRLLPASRRQRARSLGDEVLAKVGGYTVGALSIAAIAGGCSFVFMLIAGVPYAYALAFVVAVLDLIPQVGATLGAVVVTLVGLTVSVWVGVACAVFFILYQQLENWLIYPAVMRRSVKVSDLAAILGILIGAALLGVVGALLAVPAVATVQLLVREVYIPRQDAT